MEWVEGTLGMKEGVCGCVRRWALLRYWWFERGVSEECMFVCVWWFELSCG
jgi:hypothetical protein